ncbi:unnamed protein product [Schistocephalus solidus]|uniref:RIC3 domain-containing protein n=1 Tax=Schistocephalus solidus TaxID=70667 RepID=A0A183SSR1_SCHSO|nr:unnamed protein product [Schistocephalus solidus]
MYDPSLRTKSYITLAVICVGFAFMIPIVFKPFFLRMLGHSPEQPTYVHDDRPNMGRLFGNKNQTVPSRKEKYLKDYYRNFRYNVDKEKFMMDSDSSDEDNSLLRDGLCDDAEVHRLRVRLEEVEQEMTRLLEVVNSATLPRDSSRVTLPCSHHRSPHPYPIEEQAHGSLECIEKTDEDEALLSASEGDGEVSFVASVFSPRDFYFTLP